MPFLSEAFTQLSAPARGPSGFRELDEVARDPESRGFVAVQAAPAVLDAVARHVERRARALGRPVVSVGGLPADDPWRELTARFSSSSSVVPLVDAMGAAQAVVDRAGGAALVVREGAPTAFGRALSDELGRLLRESSSRCLLVVLAEAAEACGPIAFGPQASARRLIEVDPQISAEDGALWWEAAARDAGTRAAPEVDRLDTLERWWAAARTTPLTAVPPPLLLSADAARLLARVAISQRSWPAAQILKLARASAAEELVRAGALALDASGWLSTGPALTEATLAAVEADDADRRAVAAALEALHDPWAAARASELHAALGRFDEAERAALRAVSSLGDPAARADFWRRWEQTLAALPDAEAVPRLLRSADLALRAGELDRALGLGNAALAKRPAAPFRTLLTLGRANVARGDLPTAGYWLGKALASGGDDAERAMVEVELAEVRHMEGDIAGAERHARAAEGAVADGSDPERGATRLHARNVLGKILLAGSAWQQAEQHFAGDACEAALLGDAVAELRARLNRSIALLSSGRLDEARAMLAAVLDEGEGRGELRAVAYALTNLATIAILKRDYAEALRLSERAFEARRRLGDKISLALLIANLAELKLMLGQTAEAEQTLAFGRKACGPGMPGARASHFAYTAALIHLERGQTVEAKSELGRAFSTVHGSNHGARLGECHRLAARVALEDGDLPAAEAALTQAAALAETPREKAWAALLSALHARAAGDPFGEVAAEALDRARGTDDPELVREAHVLAHHAAVAREDARAARAHLEAAAAVRDQIASALPEDLRRRYLARRDLAELGRVEAAFAADGAAVASVAKVANVAPADAEDRPSLREPPRIGLSAAPPALRRMVGRTPSMLALCTAIKKIGPSDATVLVHGESGTGKELVAEAIHEASGRRSGPLVKVNCAALVETLLLSELFGHEKGSFTGAAARRRGRFEAAEGGTLFLDEIGDISPRTQVALLRVLQDKTFERVGGVTPIRANVRIVCATHRDLVGMVSRGEFREDLYYRLRGVVLEVPALRSRLADLGTVADAILDRVGAERGMPAKRLSPAALDGLSRHAWPGNVRELENAIRAAALFADGEELTLADFTNNVASLGDLAKPALPAAPLSLVRAVAPVAEAFVPDVDAGTVDASDLAPMTQPSKSARSVAATAAGGPAATGESATDVAYAAVRGGVSLSDLKRDIERECIARALAETSGNITRAAGLLGMKRPRLSQLVKQYGFGGSGAAGDVEIEAEDGE